MEEIKNQTETKDQAICLCQDLLGDIRFDNDGYVKTDRPPIASLKLDESRYIKYLDDDISEEEASEILQILWDILLCLSDLNHEENNQEKPNMQSLKELAKNPQKIDTKSRLNHSNNCKICYSNGFNNKQKERKEDE